MEIVRRSFKTTRETTVNREQEEGYAEDPREVRSGTTIWAAVAGDEQRTLNGRPVKVVLFTIDTSGWYWMPRDEFLRSAEEFDIKQQTGIPFQK
jgi:hypothetical protein